MLLLLFHIGNERYALDTCHVIEITPLVNLNSVPHAPAGVAGIFNYHGRPVPAVDLSKLFTGHPAQKRLSTRLIVVRFTDANGRDRLLGLIAEQATGTLRRQPEEFVDCDLKLQNAPYLGPVLLDPQGSVRLIHEDRLIPQPALDLLLPPPATAPA